MKIRTTVYLKTVRRIILTFPGVEEGPCYGKPGLREVIEEAWRRSAPKRLIAAYDQRGKTRTA